MQIKLDEYLRDSPIKESPEIELTINESKIVKGKYLLSLANAIGHKEIVSGYFKNRMDIEKLRNYLDAVLANKDFF